MAETPTIQIDVSVMLEKLERELRRVEEMVGRTSARIDGRLRGGAGGGAVAGGAVGAAGAVGGGMIGGSTFVPSAAGARVGVVTATGGGGSAVLAGAGAAAAGGGLGGAYARSAFLRFAGPAAAITAATQLGFGVNRVIERNVSGRDERGALEQINQAFIDLTARIPFSEISTLRAGGSALGTARRNVRRSEASRTLEREIADLDFGRRMSSAIESGDTRRQQQLVIEQTVAEMSKNATALRAAGIAPELIDKRNRLFAQSVADEIGGGSTGSVDRISTAAGIFSVGQSGNGAMQSNQILEKILGELEKLNGNVAPLGTPTASALTVGTIG